MTSPKQVPRTAASAREVEPVALAGAELIGSKLVRSPSNGRALHGGRDEAHTGEFCAVAHDEIRVRRHGRARHQRALPCRSDELSASGDVAGIELARVPERSTYASWHGYHTQHENG
ncbi:hypothetical protein [Sorangium sp. So ce426]|uniref:hypothetical protein n=1 Tax=unclassified Sorangium TaxID=2621164 RepID=UPI003F5B1FCC